MGGEVVERRDAAESRRRILAAARRLFGECGVDAVSMHEVGRAAGVGQGTLYRRFGHKGDLCAALLGEKIEVLMREVQAREESELALERLGWVLDRTSVFNGENGAFCVGMRNACDEERRVEMYRNPFYAWLRATVRGMLDRAVEEDEISGLDAEHIADVLLAALNIDLYFYQRRELGMDRERIVASLNQLLDGLRA
ncbi:MAG: TetR/AcrR family transcriptional regulator [Rubrobacteraceae bacterium]